MTKLFPIVLILVMAVGACAGTMPSAKTSQRAITRHLHHYAKKFPKSDLGQHRLEKVELYDQALDKRNHVNAIAFFTLADQGLYQAAFTLKHEPLGWTVLSWEILQAP